MLRRASPVPLRSVQAALGPLGVGPREYRELLDTTGRVQRALDDLASDLGWKVGPRAGWLAWRGLGRWGTGVTTTRLAG